MFTGIVQHLVQVRAVKKRSGFMQLVLTFPEILLVGLECGASVAVDGVCLTVVTIEGLSISFDVIDETLRRTTLGQLKAGDCVHVERAAKFGDEIGGHFLSGHVYGKGRISEIQQGHNNYILSCQVEPAWMKYILAKGSIAIDGVSLTLVTAESSGQFSVHLIPETLRRTKLGRKNVDATVNIEIDGHAQAIVDTVERYINHAH